MPLSEGAVQADERLKASQAGGVLWRNNSGAYLNDSGQQVRYGLANDSTKVNKATKSSDLVGITRVVVTADMVGLTLGVFTAVECKPEGWKFGDGDRDEAQKKFLDLVMSMGGIGRFESGG